MAKRNEQRFPYFGAAATSDLDYLLGRGGWAISLYIQLSQRKLPAANQTTTGAVRDVRLDRALRDECKKTHQSSDPPRRTGTPFDFSRAPKRQNAWVVATHPPSEGSGARTKPIASGSTIALSPEVVRRRNQTAPSQIWDWEYSSI